MIQQVPFDQLVQKSMKGLLSLIVDNKEENIYYIEAKDWVERFISRRSTLKLYGANDYRINKGYKCVFCESESQIGIRFEFHEQHQVFNPFYDALHKLIRDFNCSFDTIMFKIEEDQSKDYILTVFCIGDKINLLNKNVIFKKE